MTQFKARQRWLARGWSNGLSTTNRNSQPAELRHWPSSDRPTDRRRRHRRPCGVMVIRFEAAAQQKAPRVLKWWWCWKWCGLWWYWWLLRRLAVHHFLQTAAAAAMTSALRSSRRGWFGREERWFIVLTVINFTTIYAAHACRPIPIQGGAVHWLFWCIGSGWDPGTKQRYWARELCSNTYWSSPSVLAKFLSS